MSGLGAPNCSRTYFCHRIPPLRFEFPHGAICARDGLKNAGMTETAARQGRNANCLVPVCEKLSATFADRLLAVRISSVLFTARHHG